MSPLRRPLAQRSQDRALTTFAACTVGNGSLQFTGYSAQFTHPLLDVDEVMSGQLIHVVAGQRGIVGQRQETADLLQTESELARRAALSKSSGGIDAKGRVRSEILGFLLEVPFCAHLRKMPSAFNGRVR